MKREDIIDSLVDKEPVSLMFQALASYDLAPGGISMDLPSLHSELDYLTNLHEILQERSFLSLVRNRPSF